MTTNKAQLETIKSQALQIIADITARPKPTYTIDEQSVSWSEYLMRLEKTVAWCDRMLAGEDPFEIQTRGTT